MYNAVYLKLMYIQNDSQGLIHVLGAWEKYSMNAYMYQALHLERNPMYVFLNLKFMYQMAGAVLSLLMCHGF